MVKYKIDKSFTDLLKQIVLSDKILKKTYKDKHPNTKYSLDLIINEIIYVLKTGISWRDLRSSTNWNTLYHHFKKFKERLIFKKLFKVLQKRYLKFHTINTMIVDSSFIPNKYGRNKISRNKFFKNKNCNKISLVTDVNGIPLSVFIDKGSIHDIPLFYKHLNDIENINFNVVLLADKGYTSKKLKEDLLKSNISVMIPTKKGSKRNENFDKILYKKRIIIENTFQKLKADRRLSVRYDNLIGSYKSFLLLSLSSLIFKNLFSKI